MHTLHHLIDIFLHLNQYLANIVAQYGIWTYVLLFVIIFCETGLVVTPFLPGDSLLFAAGAVANNSSLNIHLLSLLLITAATLGNISNYYIGRWAGPKIFSQKTSRWLNRKHLEQAHEFYETYGGWAIVFARFVPIIRTFAPFVAGIAKMSPAKFQLFSATSSIAWVSLFAYLGYWFGNTPIVKHNFSFIIVMVIIITIIPPIIGYLKNRLSKH